VRELRTALPSTGTAQQSLGAASLRTGCFVTCSRGVERGGQLQAHGWPDQACQAYSPCGAQRARRVTTGWRVASSQDDQALLPFLRRWSRRRARWLTTGHTHHSVSQALHTPRLRYAHGRAIGRDRLMDGYGSAGNRSTAHGVQSRPVHAHSTSRPPSLLPFVSVVIMCSLVRIIGPA